MKRVAVLKLHGLPNRGASQDEQRPGVLIRAKKRARHQCIGHRAIGRGPNFVDGETGVLFAERADEGDPGGRKELYFVLIPNSGGRHDFSQTLAEHNAKARKYGWQ